MYYILSENIDYIVAIVVPSYCIDNLLYTTVHYIPNLCIIKMTV